MMCVPDFTYLAGWSGALVNSIRLTTKENFCIATMLLFYILQRCSVKGGVFFFLYLSLYSISGCENSLQCWCFHLICLCVVINDCNK